MSDKLNMAEVIPDSVPDITEKDLPDGILDAKSRRKAKRFETNPFLAVAAANTKIGTKRIVNKQGDRMMIVSQETGEIVAPAGFHEIVEVDKTQFVKVYVNGMKAFKQLKSAGAAVFEVICFAAQENHGTDELYLHFAGINQEVTPMSESTFYRGMKEMIEKGFIAESTRPNVFFLNIDFMFSGNRLALIKEFRVKASKALPRPKGIPALPKYESDQDQREALEAHGQLRLDAQDEQKKPAKRRKK